MRLALLALLSLVACQKQAPPDPAPAAEPAAEVQSREPVPGATLLALDEMVDELPFELTPGDVPVGETVELSFDWADGATARVDAALVERHARVGELTRVAVEYRYDLRVARSPELVDLSATDLVIGATEFEGSMPEPVQQVAEGAIVRLGVAEPPFQVGPEGAWVGLGDTEGFETALRDELAALMADEVDDLDSDPIARSVLGSVDVAALEPDTYRDWYILVGAWGGRTLTFGEPTATTHADPVGWPGHDEIAMQVTLRALDRVPCVEGDQRADCVLLGLEMAPAPEVLQAAAEDLAAAMFEGSGLDTPQVARVGYATRARVVVEPATLRPHRVESLRALHYELTPPEGENVAIREMRHLEASFDWSEGAAQ